MKLSFANECESCKLLKEIIDYERKEKAAILETLTSLLKPQVIIQPETDLRPIQPKHQLWSKRRAEIEKRDRENAQLIARSPVAAKSDSEIQTTKIPENNSVTQLEMELGISETEH